MATRSRRAPFVAPLVDGRDLGDPAPPVGMLHLEHGIGRPMKVISDEGYLLVKPLEGVA